MKSTSWNISYECGPLPKNDSQPVAIAPAPPAGAVVIPAMAVSEFTSLLKSLTVERAEAHKQMCLRSNRLAEYPDETILVDLVYEIQEWKLKRNALGEQISYLKIHGRLPEVLHLWKQIVRQKPIKRPPWPTCPLIATN